MKTPTSAFGLMIAASGADTDVTLTDETGSAIATFRIHPADAGGLGGQLLSAAHRPLQAPYTLTRPHGGSAEPAVEPKPTTGVTPALMADRARLPAPEVLPSTTVWSSSLPGLDDEPWRFSNSALEHLDKHGITREEAIAAVEDPDQVTPAEYGGGTTYLRRGVGVLVPADEPRLIIAVFRDAQTGRSERPRGGTGRRMPSSFTELKALLEEHGFTITNGGSHPKAQHPGYGGQIILPSSPSDLRSFRNTIATIRRLTGIDITKHETGEQQ